MLSKERSSGNPFGAGDAGEKTVAIMLERFSRLGDLVVQKLLCSTLWLCTTLGVRFGDSSD